MMFIKRIRLQGFGRLTGVCEFQPGKCNVLCQDNEFGKSTLMDAVLYAFYNFPSTGYRRNELKPKDRYKPWFAEGNGSGSGRGAFRVELELVNPEGRELLLAADFSRPQPFELRDLHTHQSIPLDGTSFGKRYFRMPIESFTECFFFRQDERERPGRDDLIRVIEEAAASNQRQQPSSVRQAISALSDARMHIPEFSADAIQVETLLKRIDEKAAGIGQQYQQISQERDRRAAEITAAEQMDQQLAQLEEQRAQLELALLAAEIAELEATLQRQSDLASAHEQRRAVLAELEPYGAFDPAARGAVESLYNDYRSVQQRIESTRGRLEQHVLPGLAGAEEALEALPAEVRAMELADLERVRGLRSVLAERRRHLAEETQRVADLQDQLRASGVPVEEVEELLPQLEALPESDRRCLLDSDGKRAALEASVSNAERRAADARALVARAKAVRGQLSTYAGAVAAGAASLLVVAVVLLLTGYTLAGSALLAIAVIGGGVAMWQVTKRREHVVRTELEPATSQEVSINGEAQKLREKAENDQLELAECMSRNGLDDEALDRLKAVSQWMQAAIPYRAACIAQQRTGEDFEDALDQAQAELAQIANYDSTAEPTEADLDHLATEVVQALDHRATQERLLAEKDGLEQELADLERDLTAKREALEAQIRLPLESVGTQVDDGDLSGMVEAFSKGCEKAIQLQATLAQPAPEAPLDEQELVGARERLDEFKARLAEGGGDQAATSRVSGNRANIQQELTRVEKEREELRLKRINAFNECDRAVETWRREGPKLQEELDRLRVLRAEVTQYGEAVQTAHQQLSDIADEVFRQWATGINERVNEVLPLLNGRYRDVKCSNQLEISAFSTEAGRRLDSRELQHLSKGARDQLQLAVRIAVSEYLSAHVGHLPLVFDEPFAHWDDRRFIDGMRFLADLSQRHQIILLSCHHWRYEQLHAMEPALAARLNFCDLCGDEVLA